MSKHLLRDLTAGLVVFLVALPLCLGIALASDAPLMAGLISGVVAGIVVGLLSGSHTSVSGPSAGSTAVIAVQIAVLQSFEAFLLAVVVAGAMQIVLGLARAGTLSSFVPSSVIKGLLAAIGVILILKQIPHVLGHDADPEGELRFSQPDHHNTFSELLAIFSGEIHLGAVVIGLLCVAVLVVWDNYKPLKKSLFPAPLAVVILGVALGLLFKQFGGTWTVGESHLVQVPVAASVSEFLGFFRQPDFSQWANLAVYKAAIIIALATSLETLLNLEAVDKIDPQQRESPPSRELVAQGIGNLTAGLLGGIPMSSVIVRSSVNIHAGAQTKLAGIVHGALLAICVVLLPSYLNLIPLSCLAAILLVTGVKLASPALFVQMWREGRYQFLPFIATLVAIVFTDLLVGIVIGLAISLSFILASSLRRPMRREWEKRLGGEVLHIELASQVSFLNRASLERTLREAPRGTHVLLDARHTDYIDPDILSLIREFKLHTAPVMGVQVSLQGFRDKYQLQDEIKFVDYATRDFQKQVQPAQVLRILEEGNERFRTGHRLSRDFGKQLQATSQGQHPLAVVLSCIDSRSPAELIFDLGIGDIFSARIAGNVSSRKVLGSIEYACAVAGAKVVLVMGHTKCGAVTASVEIACSAQNASQVTGCQHLEPLVQEIQESIDSDTCRNLANCTSAEKSTLIDAVARRNVEHTVEQLVAESETLQQLINQRRLVVIGAMYDVATGRIDFFTDSAHGLSGQVESQTAGS